MEDEHDKEYKWIKEEPIGPYDVQSLFLDQDKTKVSDKDRKKFISENKRVKAKIRKRLTGDAKVAATDWKGQPTPQKKAIEQGKLIPRTSPVYKMLNFGNEAIKFTDRLTVPKDTPYATSGLRSMTQEEANNWRLLNPDLLNQAKYMAKKGGPQVMGIPIKDTKKTGGKRRRRTRKKKGGLQTGDKYIKIYHDTRMYLGYHAVIIMIGQLHHQGQVLIHHWNDPPTTPPPTAERWMDSAVFLNIYTRESNPQSGGKRRRRTRKRRGGVDKKFFKVNLHEKSPLFKALEEDEYERREGNLLTRQQYEQRENDRRERSKDYFINFIHEIVGIYTSDIEDRLDIMTPDQLDELWITTENELNNLGDGMIVAANTHMRTGPSKRPQPRSRNGKMKQARNYVLRWIEFRWPQIMSIDGGGKRRKKTRKKRGKGGTQSKPKTTNDEVLTSISTESGIKREITKIEKLIEKKKKRYQKLSYYINYHNIREWHADDLAYDIEIVQLTKELDDLNARLNKEQTLLYNTHAHYKKMEELEKKKKAHHQTLYKKEGGKRRRKTRRKKCSRKSRRRRKRTKRR